MVFLTHFDYCSLSRNRNKKNLCRVNGCGRTETFHIHFVDDHMCLFIGSFIYLFNTLYRAVVEEEETKKVLSKTQNDLEKTKTREQHCLSITPAIPSSEMGKFTFVWMGRRTLSGSLLVWTISSSATYTTRYDSCFPSTTSDSSVDLLLLHVDYRCRRASAAVAVAEQWTEQLFGLAAR